jgi:hypothetical protein
MGQEKECKEKHKTAYLFKDLGAPHENLVATF